MHALGYLLCALLRGVRGRMAHASTAIKLQRSTKGRTIAAAPTPYEKTEVEPSAHRIRSRSRALRHSCPARRDAQAPRVPTPAPRLFLTTTTPQQHYLPPRSALRARTRRSCTEKFPCSLARVYIFLSLRSRPVYNAWSCKGGCRATASPSRWARCATYNPALASGVWAFLPPPSPSSPPTPSRRRARVREKGSKGKGRRKFLLIPLTQQSQKIKRGEWRRSSSP